MRRQYHSRRTPDGVLVWDVHRLIRLSRDLPRLDVPLVTIGELDENWWYDQPGTEMVPTPRAIAEHMRLVLAVDLAFPVILCAEGRLMDGMHRAVRSLLEGCETIRAVRFPVTPRPDHVDVSLDDLPYDDLPLDDPPDETIHPTR